MLDVPTGIYAYVRSQPVTKPGREIVDEGDIAKTIPAAEIDAVGFEGIAAIGDKEDEPAPARRF